MCVLIMICAKCRAPSSCPARSRLLRRSVLSYSQHSSSLPLGSNDPIDIRTRRQVRDPSAPDVPPIHLLGRDAAAPHHGRDLHDGPGAYAAHPAVPDEHEGQHGDDPAPEEGARAPPAPGVVGREEQDAEAEQQHREEGAQGAVLQLDDGEPVRGGERIAKDGGSEGIGEMVEGEVEGAEGLSGRRGDAGGGQGRGGAGEEVRGRGGGVDGEGGVVELWGEGGGARPVGDVRVQVGQDEVNEGLFCAGGAVGGGGTVDAVLLSLEPRPDAVLPVSRKRRRRRSRRRSTTPLRVNVPLDARRRAPSARAVVDEDVLADAVPQLCGEDPGRDEGGRLALAEGPQGHGPGFGEGGLDLCAEPRGEPVVVVDGVLVARLGRERDEEKWG